jgi:lysozyme family protein
MRASFAPFCKYMLNDLEGGGKVHTNPGDPGGTTCWGFAQKFNPDIDVKTLTEETATARTLKNYWIANGCDELPFPMDIMVLDCAFNQSATFARGLVGMTIGTAVIARLLRYHDKTNPRFVAGTCFRVVEVLDYIRKNGGDI